MRCVVRHRTNGEVYGFLPTASVASIRDGLCTLKDSARLTFSAADPAAVEVVGRDEDGRLLGPWRREIAIWDGDGREFVGPIRRARVRFDGVVEVDVGGLGAYLDRWNFGDAERTNLLEDGGFEESGLPDWTSGSGDTGDRDNTYVNEGDYSVVIIGEGATRSQVVTFTHDYGPGLDPRVSVYCYRPSAAAQPFGGLVASLTADDNPSPSLYEIDETEGIPADKWKRVAFNLGRDLPPGTYDVTLVLFGGADGIWWDSAQIGQPESISAAGTGTDAAVLAGQIVDYGQAAKTDVGVTVDVTPCGSLVYGMAWQFSDHEPLSSALAQLVERADGIEFRFDYPTRTIEIAGNVGTRKPEWALELGHGIADGAVTLDGAAMVTDAVRVADSSDFLVEEGGYRDVDALDGLVLDGYDRAPVSSTVRELGQLAQGDVQSGSWCVEDFEFESTLPIDADVRPGDTLPARLTLGPYEARFDVVVLERERVPATGRMALRVTRELAA